MEVDYVIVKELIDTLNAGVLLEDENRIILKCNKVFTEMFNIPVEPEQLKGVDCRVEATQTSLAFTDPEKFMVNVDKILNDKVKVVNEIVYLNNGKILERDYIPLVIKGNYRGHFWNYRDITTKTKMYDFVVKTSKDNSYILSELSHEIKNPLNAVIGLSDLILMDDDVSDDVKDDIKMIKESGQTILELVNILMTKTDPNIKITEFDAGECVKTICRAKQLDAESKGLKFTYDIDLSTYSSKKIYLQQILYNLIGNSIKYTKSGSINVVAKMENGKINISVQDTGIGIAEDKISTIFEPFAQVDSSTNGIGMGLHVTKQLITTLDGQINVHSEINVGSRFEIII
jgi:signal transduction histidine kinase